MTALYLSNLILTADEPKISGNFRSVIILCGIAGLIMLVVAIKLFYDRVIGPKIDEFELQDSDDRKKKKKKNNNNTETDDDEDPESIFQYESIIDTDTNTAKAVDDSELNDEEIIDADSLKKESTRAESDNSVEDAG